MSSGTHDCGGEAAAYALGALDAAHAREFLHHLEHCAVCRDEVEVLRGVVEALPMAAPQVLLRSGCGGGCWQKCVQTSGRRGADGVKRRPHGIA